MWKNESTYLTSSATWFINAVIDAASGTVVSGEDTSVDSSGFFEAGAEFNDFSSAVLKEKNTF